MSFYSNLYEAFDDNSKKEVFLPPQMKQKQKKKRIIHEGFQQDYNTQQLAKSIHYIRRLKKKQKKENMMFFCFGVIFMILFQSLYEKL